MPTELLFRGPDWNELVGFKSSIQVLPRSGHLFAHMMAKSTRGARKASRRGNRATTRVQNRQLKPSDAIFRPSCGDSTKKVCTGVGARGGCRTVSPVRGLQWNREKTSSLPAFRSKERLVDGSSDRPLRLVNSPPASTLYFLTYTYRRNQASDPWKDAGGTRREMPERTGVLSAKSQDRRGTKREIRGTRREIQKPQGY